MSNWKPAGYHSDAVKEAQYNLHLAIGDVDRRLPFYKVLHGAEHAPGIEAQLAIVEYIAALVSEGLIGFREGVW